MHSQSSDAVSAIEDRPGTDPAILQRLAQIGSLPDQDIDLAEAALCLAAVDRPQVDLARYRRELAQIAMDLADYTARFPDKTTASDAVEAMKAVITGRHGYQGDTLTYDDLQNANLIRVMDRRKGLPVALGILYIHAARAQGWDICGINFPGHFLLRLDRDGERCLVDPFNGAVLAHASDLRQLLKAGLGPDAELLSSHYAPVTNREILIRLQNNIKLRLMRRHQVERALRVVDTMLLIAPQQAGLLRECGFLNAHLGNLQNAVDALQRFLAAPHSDPSARYEVAAVLQDLKSRLP